MSTDTHCETHRGMKPPCVVCQELAAVDRRRQEGEETLRIEAERVAAEKAAAEAESRALGKKSKKRGVEP